MEKIPPENPDLAANMGRLKGERSIQDLRADMAAAGIRIGQGTLHMALQGRMGNRLESLGKMATFFGVTTDQLLQPDLGAGGSTLLAPDLEARIAGMDAVRRSKFEAFLRAHFAMEEPDGVATAPLVPSEEERAAIRRNANAHGISIPRGRDKRTG